MSDNNKTMREAKKPSSTTWTAEREQEWRKAKYKRMVADLPIELSEIFIEVLKKQGKTFQGWVREEAENHTKK